MQLARFSGRVLCLATLAFVTACSSTETLSRVAPPIENSVHRDPLFSVTFVYAVNGVGSNISGYQIGSGGALIPLSGSPFAAGHAPIAMTIVSTSANNTSHTWAYVPDNANNNVIAYSLNTHTGALTQIAGSPFPAGTGPVATAASASGPFLYAANRNSNNVSAYTINATTGALTAVAGSPFGAGSSPS